MDEILLQLREVVTFYGLNIIAALIIYLIGKWIAKFLQGFAERLMNKSKVDPTLSHFVSNLAYIGMLTFVILAALSQLGIQTTSFIAVLGAAGLAIGLALKGSLSNFAAGVLLILFRPFKKGDFIEGAGTAGTVEEIQIFTTMLVTPDNRLIIVPNDKLIADNIINISAKATRRVDFVFGVGYGDDVDKVKGVISEVAREDARVLRDPDIFVGVGALADNSVNFTLRVWVQAADYWPVFFSMNERMKKRFDHEQISIPYPQRDVYLHAVEKGA